MNKFVEALTNHPLSFWKCDVTHHVTFLIVYSFSADDAFLPKIVRVAGRRQVSEAQELTKVSDWGEGVQPTRMQLEI